MTFDTTVRSKALQVVLFVLGFCLCGNVDAQARAYVPNSGGISTLSVIDASLHTVIDTIDVPDTPFSVAIQPDGSLVYLGHLNLDLVSVVDTGSGTVIETIPGLDRPQSLAIHPQGTFLYVALPAQDAVAVIDTSTNSIIAMIDIGFFPVWLAVHPQGGFLYATTQDSAVSVIDTATNTFIDTIAVGTSPNGVAVHPDGATLYVANWNDDTVSVIDTASRIEVETIPVSEQPLALSVLPDGSALYVSHDQVGALGVVSVIDTLTNTVVETVPVGDFPQGLSSHPESTFVYVAISSEDKVAVIETATNSVLVDVPVGDGPVAHGEFLGPVANAPLPITVDIKPGSEHNPINPRSPGLVPVAILTIPDFDATEVDPRTVAFGPDGAGIAHRRGHIVDVDYDGDRDLLLHFKTRRTGIRCGDTDALLTGATFAGELFEGSDAIRTVGCR